MNGTPFLLNVDKAIMALHEEELKHVLGPLGDKDVTKAAIVETIKRRPELESHYLALTTILIY